jgi:hypothetical protein
MSKLAWYWHRLRAMSASEMALHARKKSRQFIDARRERDWGAVKLESSGAFPKLPPPQDAPRELREALARDVEEILHGKWRAFGHLDLRVDDPPRWHKDYLVGVDLDTNESAFKLNHRALPNGADIKLIWELSRWYQLVRLAMAAYVLDDERAAHKCITWLEDWVKHNPPYRGWNWTSALEAGLRLVQFTWIDALLSPKAESWGFDAELETLRYEILPAHVWFTWRHKSFGSSANNHLIGELVGVILATVRWPQLAQWGAPLDELQKRWEHEVLAQFAEDGGTREQALSYQLFSFEFCFYARGALLAAGKTISKQANERFDAAVRFFNDVQVDREPWDYGDSDNAFVTPLFSGPHFTREWLYWMAQHGSPALEYWLNAPPLAGRRPNSGPPLRAKEVGEWWLYQDSGIAVCESGFWWLRWDLSELGYLATAAHGHLDALHLSIWWKGVAITIDPGTGAYYADKKLREWLSSRAAHNGPRPDGPEWPRRLGPFLWAEHHSKPRLANSIKGESANVDWGGAHISRSIVRADRGDSWTVTDSCEGTSTNFSVRWQFAPGARFKRVGERRFELHRNGVAIEIEVSDDWSEVFLVEQKADEAEQSLRASTSPSELEREFAGTVSPAFRKTEWAPYLKLIARPKPGQSCVFRTTFVASAAP